MRMWMCDPRILCRKHLIGEHGELHKFRHTFEKGHRIEKRIFLNQIEPKSMAIRHDTLVKEMLRRGYKHNSSYMMPSLDKYPKEIIETTEVYREAALMDLLLRCDECHKRYNKLKEFLYE